MATATTLIRQRQRPRAYRLILHGWTRSKYTYRALPVKSCFRILRILPGTRDDALKCQLHRTDFLQHPIYKALSYAWGSTERCRRITCDNESLSVTESVHIALRRFRSPHRPVDLWVDQVCINQDDLQERATQVELMGRIFQRAEEVLVWLGEEEHHSGRGIELTKRTTTILNNDRSITICSDNAEAVGLPRWHHKDWKALGNIFLRSWFTRIWIVQEVVMAARVTVVCGDKISDWADMVTLAKRIHFASHLHTLGLWNSPHPTALQRVLSIENLRKKRLEGRRETLGGLLASSRTFAATIPLDKAYSLVNLSTSRGRLPADYTRTRRSVFKEIASITLSELNELRGRPNNDQTETWAEMMSILYSAGLANQQTDLSELLPSWVPDWTAAVHERPIWRGTRGLYKAGGHDPGSLRVVIHVRGLAVRGKIVDTITACNAGVAHNIEPNPKNVKDCVTEWFNQARALCDRLPDLYVVGGLNTDAFRLTLIAGRVATADGYHAATISDADTFYEAFIWLRDLDLDPCGGYMLPREAKSTWYIRLVAGVQGRSFFVTEKGYMGLGARGIRKGDVVAIIVGAHAPVILRPSRKGYKLVGGCYVHGIMAGEAMSDKAMPMQDIMLL